MVVAQIKRYLVFMGLYLSFAVTSPLLNANELGSKDKQLTTENSSGILSVNQQIPPSKVAKLDTDNISKNKVSE